MKTFVTAGLVALGLIFGSALAQDTKTAKPAPPAGDLKDLRSQASYAIGQNIGKNLKAQDIDLDPAVIAQGIKDVLEGAKPKLSEEEAEKCMETFQREMLARREANLKKAAEKNKKEGDAYLAANKAKPGIVTTSTGLQYKVLKEGAGPIPKKTDTVKANYKGQLLDGTEFDSSYKRGEPTSFPVAEVIPGWTEALLKMKVGSKWELFIPSNLAYGERGRTSIPPNSVLIFEIELVEIEK